VVLLNLETELNFISMKYLTFKVASLALLLMLSTAGFSQLKRGRSGNTTNSSDGVIRYPDGSVRYPDGRVTYPDGRVIYPTSESRGDNGVLYPDGSVHYPNGTIRYPDGTVRYPNGNIKYPDGRIVRSDGTVINDRRNGRGHLPPGHAKKQYGSKSARDHALGRNRDRGDDDFFGRDEDDDHRFGKNKSKKHKQKGKRK
jgi:hypothetical protein